MRLNKYIAHCGVCSRRKADELIEQGAVTINGVTAHTGEDVKDGDVVAVSGRPIRPEKRLVYYLLNKPAGISKSPRFPKKMIRFTTERPRQRSFSKIM